MARLPPLRVGISPSLELPTSSMRSRVDTTQPADGTTISDLDPYLYSHDTHVFDWIFASVLPVNVYNYSIYPQLTSLGAQEFQLSNPLYHITSLQTLTIDLK